MLSFFIFLSNQGSVGEKSDQVTIFPLHCRFSVLTTLTVSQRWRFD